MKHITIEQRYQIEAYLGSADKLFSLFIFVFNNISSFECFFA